MQLGDALGSTIWSSCSVTEAIPYWWPLIYMGNYVILREAL